MTPLAQLTFWFGIINIFLLLYLLFVHIRMANSVKSSFTMGLLLFVFVFLIRNSLSTYFYLTMMDFYAHGTEIPVFIITFIETVAFAIFIWISRQ